MRIKSVQQTRLGFETSKWWKLSFTSNAIWEEHALIIQAISTDTNSIIPILHQLENGYCVEPLTDKVIRTIESLVKIKEEEK